MRFHCLHLLLLRFAFGLIDVLLLLLLLPVVFDVGEVLSKIDDVQILAVQVLLERADAFELVVGLAGGVECGVVEPRGHALQLSIELRGLDHGAFQLVLARVQMCFHALILVLQVVERTLNFFGLVRIRRNEGQQLRTGMLENLLEFLLIVREVVEQLLVSVLLAFDVFARRRPWTNLGQFLAHRLQIGREIVMLGPELIGARLGKQQVLCAQIVGLFHDEPMIVQKREFLVEN